MRFMIPALLLLPLSMWTAGASVMTYGDKDVMGTTEYIADPTEGAILEGLLPGQTSFGMLIQGHAWGFEPELDDLAGTDGIYVGSVQTGFHDGYSFNEPRFNGPQVIVLDYSSLVPANSQVAGLTLGIAADDFQNVPFGQPFSASINGMPHGDLTDLLNQLDQTGPVTQFLSLGLDPALLSPTHVLSLSIDQGGDGGDGWAIDFLTVGVLADGTVGAHEAPAGFALEQNMPNPFNPTTTIAFCLPEAGQASLQVHTLAGQLVRSQDLGLITRGEHRVTFDGSSLASGVYLYTLQSEFGSQTRKMVLLK